jgi:hypothetical protein
VKLLIFLRFPPDCQSSARRLPSDFAPQDYSTCYLIASLKDEELAMARERNLVRPDITRADLLAFKRSLKSQSHSEEEIRATLVAERDRLVNPTAPSSR